MANAHQRRPSRFIGADQASLIHLRIVSDANDWAVETMNKARYPLEVLLRTVSLETMRIVKALPPLDI